MIARKKTKRASGGAGRAAIAVDEEQRRHLIEDCAFFRADRFREAAPGSIREQDLKEVAVAIDAALGAGGRRRGKRGT